MSDTKKILITGGAGFIGSHLSRKLVNLGYQPIIYDNFSIGQKSNLADIKRKIKILKGNILNFEKLQKSIVKYSPEAIFHLAAIHYIPFCIKNYTKTYKVNVNGTKNLLRALSVYKDKPHFVFISTGAIYKNSNKSLSEKCSKAPIDIYGKTKLLGENLVRKYCVENNIPFTIIRLFNTYGPDELVPHVITKIIKKLKQDEVIKLGNLKTRRDFIFVSDVVDVLCSLLNRRKNNEIYNLGTGREYSVSYIIDCLKDLLKNKQKIKIKSDPALFRKQDPLHLRADIKKIKHDLHWKPRINIKHGLTILLTKEGIL